MATQAAVRESLIRSFGIRMRSITFNGGFTRTAKEMQPVLPSKPSCSAGRVSVRNHSVGHSPVAAVQWGQLQRKRPHCTGSQQAVQPTCVVCLRAMFPRSAWRHKMHCSQPDPVQYYLAQRLDSIGYTPKRRSNQRRARAMPHHVKGTAPAQNSAIGESTSHRTPSDGRLSRPTGQPWMATAQAERWHSGHPPAGGHCKAAAPCSRTALRPG